MATPRVIPACPLFDPEQIDVEDWLAATEPVEAFETDPELPELGAEINEDEPQEPRSRVMTGRGRNGAERDRGRLVHLVFGEAYPGFYGPALCGARPGRKGNGWSAPLEKPATCPRCIRACDNLP